MSTRTAIATDQAPPPLPLFPQGVRAGRVVQVSGQIATDPATGELHGPGDVAQQTLQTLRNIEAILTAGGASVGDVVMLRVYLVDRDHFGLMNEAYDQFLSERIPSGVRPARTTVIVGLPREDLLVEIDALAVIDGAEAV
ncbi:RidA family protein [Cryptosporangium arvum]|jgi:reactive intermediate/imine deaminase|uniref:RidA family protein n=1 Tax=Cryptosporangium arvum TaxID=80871 RepID=UPI0004B9C604|nr:RidA family protein [Cryptosporangium arvum]